MRTLENIQVVVDEIKDVCNKLGVVIIGSCYSEGIHGEIEIVEADEICSSDLGRITNKAELVQGGRRAYVEGIGIAKSSIGRQSARMCSEEKEKNNE